MTTRKTESSVALAPSSTLETKAEREAELSMDVAGMRNQRFLQNAANIRKASLTLEVLPGGYLKILGSAPQLFPHSLKKRLISKVLSWGLLLVLSVASSNSDAASFDCKKASNAVEKAICKSTELSRLDEEIAKAYLECYGKSSPFWKEWLKESQLKWLHKRNKTDKTTLLALHQQRLDEIRTMISRLPYHPWQVLELPRVYRFLYLKEYAGKTLLIATNEKQSKFHNIVSSTIDVETGEEVQKSTGGHSLDSPRKISIKDGFVIAGYSPSNNICWRDLFDSVFLISNGDTMPTTPQTTLKFRYKHKGMYFDALGDDFSVRDDFPRYFLVYLAELKPYPREQPDCPHVSVMPFGYTVSFREGAIAETWDSRVFLKLTDLRSIRRGFIASQVFALDENDMMLYADLVKKRCQEPVFKEDGLDIVYDNCRAVIIRDIIYGKRD